MTISGPRLRTLLGRAEKVKEAGKRAAAERLYRQIIDEAPDADAAWAGLGDVSTNPAEKEQAYQRALALNPQNKVAQQGLARLNGSQPPASPPPAAETPAVDDQWIKDAFAKQPPASDKIEETPLETLKAAEKTAVSTPTPVDTVHDHDAVTAPEEESLAAFCYRHPQRETSLRCYTCGKPICIDCARKTPVGYSCPDCLRDLEKGYYTIRTLDYLIAFAVAFVLAVFASMLVGLVGFFVFFIAPAAGQIIARVVHAMIGRRRGRWLPHVVIAALLFGTIGRPALGFLLALFASLIGAQISIPAFLVAGGFSLWTVLYLVLAGSSAYYYLKS